MGRLEAVEVVGRFGEKFHWISLHLLLCWMGVLLRFMKESMQYEATVQLYTHERNEQTFWYLWMQNVFRKAIWKKKNERKKQKQGKDEEKRDRNGKILISPLSTQILRGDTFYSPTSPKRNSVPPRRCPWNCTNILFLLTERGKVSLLWCHSALLAVDPDCSYKGVDVFLPPMPRTLKWGGKLGLSVPMDCWCYGERCTLSHSVEQCYTAHWSRDTLEVVRTLGTSMVWF